MSEGLTLSIATRNDLFTNKTSLLQHACLIIRHLRQLSKIKTYINLESLKFSLNLKSESFKQIAMPVS